MTIEELSSILQMEKLRPVELNHHLRVWERTETRPELLAPRLGLYNSPTPQVPGNWGQFPGRSFCSLLFFQEESQLDHWLWGLYKNVPFSFFRELNAYRHDYCLIRLYLNMPGSHGLSMFGLYFEDTYFIYTYPLLFPKRIREDLQQRK